MLTIEELIKRKSEITSEKESKTSTLIINDLGGDIKIKEVDYGFFNECIQIMDNDKCNIKLIYNGVIEPNLKDQTLQDAYGCTEPYDIVQAIFTNSFVRERIAREIIALGEFNGLGGVIKVEDVKNE